MSPWVIKVLYVSKIVFVDSSAKKILSTMSFLLWSDGALVLGKGKGVGLSGGSLKWQVRIAEAERSLGWVEAD